jgi:hypothetical protein
VCHVPRFNLHRPKDLRPSAVDDEVESKTRDESLDDAAESDGQALDELRRDPRVTVIAELQRLLLIECADDVAVEWLNRLHGWKLQREQRASLPDPRPRLK